MMSATVAAPLRMAQAVAAQEPAPVPAATITVCTGKACCRRGADNLLENLKATAPAEVFVCSRGCMGKCRDGPVMALENPAVPDFAQKTVLKVNCPLSILHSTYCY